MNERDADQQCHNLYHRAGRRNKPPIAIAPPAVWSNKGLPVAGDVRDCTEFGSATDERYSLDVMNATDRTRLARGYIEALKWHLDNENILKPMTSQWAHDELLAIVDSDPVLAWELMSEIAEHDQTDEVMQRVANGPLLFLIQDNSILVLPIIAESAKQSRNVRLLLSNVWDDHDLDPTVWKQIVAWSESEES